MAIFKAEPRSKTRQWLLSIPSFAWLIAFVLAPIAMVGVNSFLQRGMYGGVLHEYTFENLARLVDSLYIKIYWNSFKLAAATAFTCLLIGYPMAYVMATTNRRMRVLLLVLVMVPFWTNFVIRAYSIKVFMGLQGPVSHLLFWTGVRPELEPLTDSGLCVWLGMITNYLPFMVLPLYVTLEKFDFTLLEAARDLGARGVQVVWQVLLPMTKAGLVTGFLLVFIPALGEFVIPDMLGGAHTMLIGNLITEQFLKARDWPFGSALALVLLAGVALGFWLTEKQKEQTWA